MTVFVGDKEGKDPKATMEEKIVDRQKTNRFSSKIFGLYVIVWVAAAVYVFCTAEPREEYYLDDIVNMVNEIIDSHGARILETSFLCGLFCLLYILIVAMCTQFFVNISIGFIGCIIVLNVLRFFFTFGDSFDYGIGTVKCWPAEILMAVFMVTVLYGLKKVKVQDISKTLKASCWAYIYLPSGFLISFLVHFLIGLVILFATNVHYYLSTFLTADGVVPLSFVILSLINGIGMLWIVAFLYDLLHLILSSAFTTWFQSADRYAVTSMELHKSMISTISYNIGTVCYGSSIMSIYSAIKAVFSYGDDFSEEKLRGNQKSVFSRIVCLFYVFFPFPRFAYSLTMSSYNMTVLTGKHFYASTRHALEVILSDPLKYLVTTYVTGMTIAIGVGIIDTSLTMSYLTELDPDDKNTVIPLLLAIAVIFTVTSIVLTPIASAVNSIVLSSMKQEQEEKSIEDAKGLPTMMV